MTLPSSHFFPNDMFSCIQHCYNKPYHFILATTQSLAVIDQRFQQHPLLKWCHSLEHTPKYINVSPDPTSEDTLVFLGCYENHDVHCFQYCSGEKWNSPLGMMDHMTAVLPPQSTSNPWKVREDYIMQLYKPAHRSHLLISSEICKHMSKLQ